MGESGEKRVNKKRSGKKRRCELSEFSPETGAGAFFFCLLRFSSGCKRLSSRMLQKGEKYFAFSA